jgi:LacI family transcriptional regulator
MLSSVQKRTVLLLLTDTHHGFFQGVARYAREHRWHLVADMVYSGKIPLGWRGDGILSFVGYRDDLAQFVMRSKLPVVEISMVRHDLGLPCVEGDNSEIGRLAAEHFLERGFKHFAWAPFMEDIVNEERCCGFAERLAKAGGGCHAFPAANSRRGGGSTLDWAKRRAILMRELRDLPKPLAVFGYNDCVAADIIDACEEAELAVPEAVAVLGVDNDAILCESLRVPLSSVRHDLEGMAYRAAELLDRLMNGRKPPMKPIRIRPLGLVTRRSTEIVATENLPVARALRFIADRYANPLLGVSDVVTASGVSRRPLEKQFRRELKRTINEEILRVRIAKARELLVATRAKINEVSAATGFTSANHLFRVFRERFGTTPRKYRSAEATRARPETGLRHD